MKYKAIIYDLDGTLLDSRRDIVNTTNATIIKLGGKPLTDDQVYACVGKGVVDLVRNALPRQDDEYLDLARKCFDDHYHENCLVESDLYPGGYELISELSSLGIKQAIFTNKPQNFTDKIMAGLAIEHHFHAILGAENGYPFKPAREGTDYLLGKLGSEAKETLMVGDSIVDLQTAQNVGMDCVLMLDGYSLRDELLAFKQDVVSFCETMADLRRFLLG